MKVTPHSKLENSWKKIHYSDECGKSFQEKPCLTQHQRIHITENHSECNDSETAVKESHLALNQRINTREKSFKGNKCEKSSCEAKTHATSESSQWKESL